MVDVIDKLIQVRAHKIIEENGQDLLKYDEELERPLLYHYTSANVLLSLLEYETFWLSNSIYSNDRTEGNPYFSTDEEVAEWLEDRKIDSNYDDYILCLCRDGDKLSQWRGYCYNGGVSIGMALDSVAAGDHGLKKMPFSVLTGVGTATMVKNAALPIRYVEYSENKPKEDIKGKVSAACEDLGFSSEYERYMLPYIKNKKFEEEGEYRISFPNKDDLLDECINFRLKADKQIVPYIKVRPGIAGNDTQQCPITKAELEQRVDTALDTGEYIILPQGHDQKSWYKKAKKMLEQKQDNKRKHDEAYILCEGHLPIRKIFVSPAHNQEVIKKQIERICQTKYWLNQVEVVLSEIPYIPPSE